MHKCNAGVTYVCVINVSISIICIWPMFCECVCLCVFIGVVGKSIDERNGCIANMVPIDASVPIEHNHRQLDRYRSAHRLKLMHQIQID